MGMRDSAEWARVESECEAVRQRVQTANPNADEDETERLVQLALSDRPDLTDAMSAMFADGIIGQIREVEDRGDASGGDALRCLLRMVLSSQAKIEQDAAARRDEDTESR